MELSREVFLLLQEVRNASALQTQSNQRLLELLSTGGGFEQPTSFALFQNLVPGGTLAQFNALKTGLETGFTTGDALITTDTLEDGVNEISLPAGKVVKSLSFIPEGAVALIDLTASPAAEQVAGKFRFFYGSPSGSPVTGLLRTEFLTIDGSGNVQIPVGTNLTIASILPGSTGTRSATITGAASGPRNFRGRVRSGTTIVGTYSWLGHTSSTLTFPESEVGITSNGSYTLEVYDEALPSVVTPPKAFSVTGYLTQYQCTLGVVSVTPGTGSATHRRTVLLGSPTPGSTQYAIRILLGSTQMAAFNKTIPSALPQTFTFEDNEVGILTNNNYSIEVTDLANGCVGTLAFDVSNFVLAGGGGGGGGTAVLGIVDVAPNAGGNPHRRAVILSGAALGSRTYRFRLLRDGTQLVSRPVTLDTALYPSIDFTDQLEGITSNGTYTAEVRDEGTTVAAVSRNFVVTEFAAAGTALAITGFERISPIDEPHLWRANITGYEPGERSYTFRLETMGGDLIKERQVTFTPSGYPGLNFNEANDGVRVNGTYRVKIFDNAYPATVASATYTSTFFLAQGLSLTLGSATSRTFAWAYTGEPTQAPTNYDFQYTTAADFSDPGTITTIDRDANTQATVSALTTGVLYRVRIRATTPVGNLLSNVIAVTPLATPPPPAGGAATVRYARKYYGGERYLELGVSVVGGKVRVVDTKKNVNTPAGCTDYYIVGDSYDANNAPVMITDLETMGDLPTNYNVQIAKYAAPSRDLYNRYTGDFIKDWTWAFLNTGNGSF